MPIPQAATHELRIVSESSRALGSPSLTVIWHADPDGAVDQRSPSWEAFTGQAEAQYRGWGWLDAIHPDDLEAVRQAWRTAVEARSVVEMQHRLLRSDGVYREVQSQAIPVPAGERGRAWIGVSVDLTGAGQAGPDLRRSEERLRFLDHVGQATRGLTEANEVMAATTRLLGEYLGATRCAYADVDADSDRFTIRNDWTLPGVPSSAGVYSLELFGPQATANLRNGRHLVVRDVDRELGDEGGGRMFNAIGIKAIICAGLVKGERLVAMMAVHQATPRDWTQQEVALVEEVVERCWAHIERVRDSAKLREQDRRKDEFLATLAHELRNPLAPVKYATAMLRRAQDPEQVAHAQDVIDRQVTQMARLIDDLLDLSRINRGLIRLQRERVDVAAILRQAMEATRPALEAAHHRVQVEAAGEPLWIDADPTRMVQVVANLLGNAAKYTPDGGEIRLSARRDGDGVLLEVADNGIGIRPEEQGWLFQMFTQLPHSAGRAQGGLGIGLSLARTLVEMHGGSIGVASAGVGLGSTFSVRVPLAAWAAPAPAAEPGATQPRRDGARRVLVVEDNDDGREMLVALLQALGYEVAAAQDGPQALARAATFLPQLVLLDLGLPHMDGVEVCRRLRMRPELDGAFILALTGWGTGRDRQRTAEAGADAHLTKPMEPKALEATLAHYAATWPRVPSAVSG